jgi:two-component system, cell cycle response regulator DivK
METEDTILIAEDDYASLELLKNKLEEQCKKYIAVEDGRAAVEAIRQNPKVKLVFMDIRLPELDGIEAMKQIKSLRKNVVVIAQTAYIYSVEHDKVKYLKSGFDGFVEKPLNLDIIGEIVNKYM